MVEKRGEYYQKRFGVKKPKQLTKKDDKTKTDAVPGSGGSLKPLQPTKTATQPTAQDMAQVAQPQTAKGSTDNREPSMGVAINHGLAGAQANYENALSNLRNAKTHIERIRAQQEVIRAKIALDNAYEQDREQKNKSRMKL